MLAMERIHCIHVDRVVVGQGWMHIPCLSSIDTHQWRQETSDSGEC